jgi:hypothetical protein
MRDCLLSVRRLVVSANGLVGLGGLFLETARRRAFVADYGGGCLLPGRRPAVFHAGGRVCFCLVTNCWVDVLERAFLAVTGSNTGIYGIGVRRRRQSYVT